MKMARTLLLFALAVFPTISVAVPPDPIHRDRTHELVATDPFVTGASFPEFGRSLAVSGNLLAVGAIGAGPGSLNSAGAVVLFERPSPTQLTSGKAGSWRERATLTAPTPTANSLFGFVVALGPQRLLVGAPGTTVNGRIQQGAAHVFTPNAFGVWTQQALLQAPDGDEGDQFGAAVTIAGNLAIVGAARATANGVPYGGKAYVFNLNDTGTPAPIQVLTVNGASAFGAGVSANGTSLAVGAPQTTVDGMGGRGRVYLFEQLRGNTFALRTSITRTDSRPGDQFGFMVALTSKWLTASSPTGWDADGIRGGLVSVFDRERGELTHVQDLSAQEGMAGDLLGLSALSVNNDTIVAGASVADINGNIRQGVAYVFSLQPNGQFAQSQILFDPMGQPDDYFGWASALTASWGADVLVSGMGVNSFQGSASVYRAARVSVSASASSNGQITPSGTTYPLFGQVLTYQVTANPGYRIARISGCPGRTLGTDANTLFTTEPMGTASCSLHASFVRR